MNIILIDQTPADRESTAARIAAQHPGCILRVFRDPALGIRHANRSRVDRAYIGACSPRTDVGYVAQLIHRCSPDTDVVFVPPERQPA